jgi:hypothetical protein
MDLHNVMAKAQKLVADNSPLILTAMAVTGTVTTAYLTGKATVKAMRVIDWEKSKHFQEEKSHELLPKEKVALTWRLYIPAAGTGVMTIACIVTANRIGTRRAAAMAAAYSVSEKAWNEYKDKVVEKLGANKEQAVRDEIAQDRVNQNPVSTREVIITGAGDVRCYDSITGRYFDSNVEALKKAENAINYQILHNMYASLYEFFDLIGLPPTPWSTEVGWNADCLLELNFSTVMSEDGKPCISLNYQYFPIRDYNRLQ